jgi:hypothetical protein
VRPSDSATTTPYLLEMEASVIVGISDLVEGLWIRVTGEEFAESGAAQANICAATANVKASDARHDATAQGAGRLADGRAATNTTSLHFPKATEGLVIL